MKPRLLDLFCGAGGAARGYQQAGFHVTGVDINPQPRYCGDVFIQGDAMDVLNHVACGSECAQYVWMRPFDAVHASPPCHDHSTLRTVTGLDHETGWMLQATIARLVAHGAPFIVENVEGAKALMPGAIRLCGSSFGLRIRRHRLFLLGGGFDVALLPPCAHHWQRDRIFPALNGADRRAGGRSGIMGVYGNGGDKRADLWPEAMGIDWMTRAELTQAIPPAYTEFIGTQLLAHLAERAA